MSEESIARVDRLVAWIKRHRKDLCDEHGQPSSTAMAGGDAKRVTYWSDVLRVRTSKKPFGARAARMAEAQFGIPRLHLEGSEWPFEDVDQERFERLSPLKKGRVEQALIEVLNQIEAESRKQQDTAA